MKRRFLKVRFFLENLRLNLAIFKFIIELLVGIEGTILIYNAP